MEKSVGRKWYTLLRRTRSLLFECKQEVLYRCGFSEVCRKKLLLVTPKEFQFSSGILKDYDNLEFGFREVAINH
jgi:hypothetical protein